ncbi:30S ribosomal protein S2 [Candidatus Parcubacteria bacterium]|nr:30S ribosomal protein S2 [Candidatus Parcubacteria bacterium]
MEVKNSPKSAIENLFKAGAHFAYSKSRRHPSAKPFIFGVKNKVEIFDLEKTEVELQKAKDFVKTFGETGAQMLFVGGKSEAKEAIKNVALSLNMPYVAGRWIGGSLTNFPEIRKRVIKLETLTSQKEKGELAKYTKKERLLIDRDITRLQTSFSGLVTMKELPKVMFVVDSKKEHIAVAEAKKNKLTIISLSGSDCDLGEVDYAIPGNDVSMHSIAYVAGEIASAYKEGLALKKTV